MKLPGDSVVPSKINGQDMKPVRVSPGAAVHHKQEQAGSKAGRSVDAESDVQLTGTSRHLAAIEQTLRSMPAVDELRVAIMQQRLGGGEYKVDPQRVADKLLHMEGDLQRGGPLDQSLLK
jgi:negative regulator of flagellin synthesis FlgM